MNWEQVKRFYYVAHYQGITTAAERLSLNHTSLSRSILSLESSLKTKLFHRYARSLQLTKEGQILFDRAKKFLVELEMAETAICQAQDKAFGPLTIASFGGWIATLLLPDIQSFLDENPDVELRIMHIESEANKLAFDEYDITIRPYVHNRPDLIQKYLTTFTMKLYTSKQYVREYGTPACAEDLDNHRLITYGDSKMLFAKEIDWILKVGRKSGQPRKPYMRINSAPGLHMAAKLGLGIISFTQESLYLKEGSLVPVLPELEGPSFKVYFTYPKHLDNLKAIQRMEQHLERFVHGAELLSA